MDCLRTLNCLVRELADEPCQSLIALPLKEPSFFGIAPHDSFVREVGAFIWQHAQNAANVEVEAKVGVLLDTRTPAGAPAMRLDFPVRTETSESLTWIQSMLNLGAVLADVSIVRFESNMTQSQHANYNKLLNARVEEQSSPEYQGVPIRYKHTYELDAFHETTAGRIRVTYTMDKTRKNKTLKENGCVLKHRLADLNVFWPNQPFDFRVSVSTENPGA